MKFFPGDHFSRPRAPVGEERRETPTRPPARPGWRRGRDWVSTRARGWKDLGSINKGTRGDPGIVLMRVIVGWAAVVIMVLLWVAVGIVSVVVGIVSVVVMVGIVVVMMVGIVMKMIVSVVIL